MGVRGRIRRIVVRAEVCLRFNDAAANDAGGCAMQEQFAEQEGRHSLRWLLEEAAPQQTAGQPNRLLVCYLCALFHSLIRASTSSAWPSGVTLGKMCRRV